MNRRATIIFTALAAAAVFAAGAYFYSRSAGEQAQAVTQDNGSRLVRPDSPILGPASAPVTIVEFFDPSCEACRAFFPTVKQIMATYPQDVRVVIRYTPFHPASQEAVRVLEAARKQNLFERVMAWLLQNQESWGADGNPQAARIWDFAQEVGLDVAQGKKDGATPEVDAIIARDMADVEAVGITGTPTFFINGKPLASFGRQQLIDAVAREVEALKSKS